MVYTEVKEKNENKYYYRVKSIRKGKNFNKKRIYLGKNLTNNELLSKEKKADIKLKPSDKKNKALEKIKPKIIRILKNNKVKKAGIFGSYARGEIKKNSDIDILIEPPKGMGLKFFGLNLELEKKLGIKVDLLTYNGINPHLKKYILSDEVRII